MKNILRFGVILAVLTVACMAIVGAGSAADSGLSWSVADNHLDITYDGIGTGIMDDYDSCGPWGTGLTSVSLPDGLKSIGNNAFNGCTKLAAVTIPDTVTDIGDGAFFNCYKIEEIVIPSGVTVIENNTFNGCKALKYVSLPSEVTTIGYTSFSGCKALAYINIPSTVNSIGDYAFYNIAKNSIIYTEGDTSYFSGENPKYSASRTAIAKDNSDNSYTFIFDDDSFTTGFPLTYINSPVKSTSTFEGWYAESSCTGDIITEVSNDQKTVYAKWTETPSDKYKITYSGDSNGTISATAKGYSLTSGYKVDGGSSVVFTITPNAGYVLSTFTVNGTDKWSEAVGGTYTIANLCENTTVSATFATGGSCGDGLTWKVIDNNLTIMYDGVGTGVMDDYTSDSPAPWGTSITSLSLSEGLKSIGDGAFNGCSNITGNLTIPSSVTSIGGGAFFECRSFSGDLIIPSNVVEIEEGAFYRCSGFTGSLIFSQGIKSIGRKAFFECGNFSGSLVLPSTVESIGEAAFMNCSGFTGSLTLPSNLTTIGYVAFSGCSGITGNITIPSNVTSIGIEAFSGCSGIQNIFVESDNNNYKDYDGVLLSKDETRIISCPAGKVSDSYTIPASVTTIGEGAFIYCSKLSGSLKIPEGVITIENDAFNCCSSFSGTLVIPSSVTNIGRYAFSNCNGINRVFLPATVESVGGDAFRLLSSDSVIYILDETAILEELHSHDKTAIAKDNGDNSFTFTVDSTSFPSGFTLNDANAPITDGKMFLGWYTDLSDPTSKVTSVTDGQTLYAMWTENPVEVSTTNITFTTQKEGYTVPDEKLVTVSNNTDSTTVTVSASSQNFTYSGLGEIPARQFAIIHVQPVSELGAGEYSDVIHITYNDGSSVVDKEVSVKFSVIKTSGKEEETVIPDLPEISVKTDSTGKTVSVEASSSFVTFSGTEPGEQTATIQKSPSNVKLEITKATVTVSGGNTKVELSSQSTITAVYPETSADNKQKVTESTYSLDVGMETVDGNLPTISGEFNSNVSKKVEDLGYTAEYMISAINTDLTGINENVSTVTPRFTINTGKLPADHSMVKIIHTSEDKYGSEFTEILTPTFTEQGSGNTIVSATSTRGFSSYVLAYGKPTPTYSVSFVTDYGTAPASQQVIEGGTATDPGKLTCPGYVFGGWYSDSACTVPYGFSTPVTSNITLYAKWTEGDFDVSTNSVTFDTLTEGYTVSGEKTITISNMTDSGTLLVLTAPMESAFTYTGIEDIPSEQSRVITIQPVSGLAAGEYSGTISIKFKDSTSTVEKIVVINLSVLDVPEPEKKEEIVVPKIPSMDIKIDKEGKTTEVTTSTEVVTTSGTVPGEQTATIQKDENSVKIEITNATVAVSEEETKIELTDDSTITAVYPETLAENKQQVQEAAYTLDVELETANPYLPTVSGEYDTAVSRKVEAMGYTVVYMISTTNTDVSAINENVKSVTVSFIVANDKIPADRSRVKIVHTSTDNDPEEFTEILTPTFTKKDENTTIVSATSERGFSVYTFAMDAANMVASGGETTTTFFGRYQGDNTYQFERAVVVTELIVPDGFDRSESVSYSHKESGMPDDGYYQFTLSAPGYNKGETGMLSFQILLGDLGVKGYETHDIVLKKGDAELPTWFLYDDGKYVYYLSEITDAGTYVISFVRGGSEELPIQEVSSEPGYLNIRSTPQHAAITINGVSYGETPQTGIELEPGTYAIKLELDWYNPYMDTVTIAAGETLDFYQRLEQTDERKEAAKTPFPIIGVLAGLGVAGVLALRRR